MSQRPTFFLPYQQRWLQDRSRFKIMEKSRQIGMSWATAYGCLRECATQQRPADIWVSSRDEIQARLFLEDCRKFADLLHLALQASGHPLLPDGSTTSSTQLTLANGCRIHSLSSNADAQAGKRGTRVLDEFALHPEPRHLYAIASPGITWGGSLQIISTHRGRHNYFNELLEEIRNGNPKGFSHHRVTLADALDQGFLQRLQAKLPAEDPRQHMDKAAYYDFIRHSCPDEASFRQEYLCEPEDEDHAFLSWETITKCQFQPEDRWQLTEADSRDRSRRFFLGVDIGRDHDLSVFWLLEENAGLLTTRALRVLERIPFAAQEAVLHEFMRLPGLRHACIDQTGLGRQFAERATARYGASRVEGVAFTAQSKEDMAYNLRGVMERGNLRVPDDRDVTADLRAVHTTAVGQVTRAHETTLPDSPYKPEVHTQRTSAKAREAYGLIVGAFRGPDGRVYRRNVYKAGGKSKPVMVQNGASLPGVKRTSKHPGRRLTAVTDAGYEYLGAYKVGAPVMAEDSISEEEFQTWVGEQDSNAAEIAAGINTPLGIAEAYVQASDGETRVALERRMSELLAESISGEDVSAEDVSTNIGSLLSDMEGGVSTWMLVEAVRYHFGIPAREFYAAVMAPGSTFLKNARDAINQGKPITAATMLRGNNDGNYYLSAISQPQLQEALALVEQGNTDGAMALVEEGITALRARVQEAKDGVEVVDDRPVQTYYAERIIAYGNTRMMDFKKVSGGGGKGAMQSLDEMLEASDSGESDGYSTDDTTGTGFDIKEDTVDADVPLVPDDIGQRMETLKRYVGMTDAEIATLAQQKIDDPDVLANVIAGDGFSDLRQHWKSNFTPDETRSRYKYLYQVVTYDTRTNRESQRPPLGADTGSDTEVGAIRADGGADGTPGEGTVQQDSPPDGGGGSSSGLANPAAPRVLILSEVKALPYRDIIALAETVGVPNPRGFVNPSRLAVEVVDSTSARNFRPTPGIRPEAAA